MIEITNIQAENLIAIIATARYAVEEKLRRALDKEKEVRAIWISGKQRVTPEELEMEGAAVNIFDLEILYLSGLHAELTSKLASASSDEPPRMSAMELLDSYL